MSYNLSEIRGAGTRPVDLMLSCIIIFIIAAHIPITMHKLINIIICIAFLMCLGDAQRRYGDQFKDRKSTELSVQRKKHLRQNSPSKLQNRTYSHQIQPIRETTSAQGQKQSSTVQPIDQTSQRNSRQYSHRSSKQRHEKPLLKLIFVMLGALLIITFILLLNFIAKRSRQERTQDDGIIKHAQYKGQIGGNPHIEMDLDQEINLQKQRLRHLEKLKQIRRKCPIYIPNSNNELVKYSDESHIEGIEPSTPVFGTSISPENYL